jgi:hypothetical protein
VVGKMEGGAKVPLSNDVSAASRDRAESLSSKAACFFGMRRRLPNMCSGLRLV